MKLCSSIAVAGPGTFTLSVQGLDPNLALSKLVLRVRNLTTTYTNPCANDFIMPPEIMAQFVNRVTYQGNPGDKILVDITGRDLNLIGRARYSTRYGASPVAVGAAIPPATDSTIYVDIPLTPAWPLDDRAFRPMAGDLDGSTVQFTLGTNNGLADLLPGWTITGANVELWAVGDYASPGQNPTVGGIYLQSFADFNGNVLSLERVDPSLVILRRRNLLPLENVPFASVDMRNQGRFVYSSNTSLDLDYQGFEFTYQYQPQDQKTAGLFQAPMGAIQEDVRSLAGNPYNRNVPVATIGQPADIVQSEDQTVIFDIRNHKSVAGNCSWVFNGINHAQPFPYVVCGWNS